MKILIADDHRIVREGLRTLLNAQQDMTVVGEAENGRSAVEMAEQLMPDVIVMDVAMPDLNGIEATRQIRGRQPDSKIVALSAHSDRRFMSEMLRAGASAYLLKDSAFEELATAIHTAMAGKTYLSPRIANFVVDDFIRNRGVGDPTVFATLTPREREVLQLIAEGKATKEVAHALSVSVKTVETHRRQLMDKLELHSVAELTKYAIREGITSVEA